ncbi:unnamed protein product [Cochlearia groenlandica]
MKNYNTKNNMKKPKDACNNGGTTANTNINVITEKKNKKKVEEKTCIDVDECAEAFITKFRNKLLLQRLKSGCLESI